MNLDAFRSESWRFFIGAVLVGVIATVPFVAGLPGEFFFDDIPNIVNNPAIRISELSAVAMADVLSQASVSGPTRGLPMLSFAVDYWRAGAVDAGAFRTTNIVIHGLTAFVMALFFRSLLLVAGVERRRGLLIALALALVWALHPLQVSSVLYVVQRIQTMATLFMMLALVAYLQGRRAQISGRPGRKGLMAAGMLWLVAMACKEDAAVLPACTLALELTVLRFKAADPAIANRLRTGYLIATGIAVAVYALIVIPAWWQWEPYPGRDFNSLERLLSQGRVLCLYLWQIVWPWPGNMSFHYDWLQPSRNLFQPLTTVPAFIVLAGLIYTAWRLRHRQPLFAAGIFLFLSSHLVTSNIVGLELAYEHRNHFALAGIVLAVASLAGVVLQRVPVQTVLSIGLLSLGALGSLTWARAHTWENNVSLTRANAMAAQNSPRAWLGLCDALVKKGGGAIKENPHIHHAIAACSAGAAARDDSLNNLVLLTVLKSVQGSITAADWEALHRRMETARMSWDNIRAPLIMTHYAGQGATLDKTEVLRAFATLDRRASLRPRQLIRMGVGVLEGLKEPDEAMPYLLKGITGLPVGDPFPTRLADVLRGMDRQDLADQVERQALLDPGDEG